MSRNLKASGSPWSRCLVLQTASCPPPPCETKLIRPGGTAETQPDCKHDTNEHGKNLPPHDRNGALRRMQSLKVSGIKFAGTIATANRTDTGFANASPTTSHPPCDGLHITGAN
jgi:hypothetical protein